MTAFARNDALRLLHAINMDQAHGCVGATIFAFDAGRSAGLESGTDR
jgi:hypothetical protein